MERLVLFFKKKFSFISSIIISRGGEFGEYSDGQKCFNAAKTYYLGYFIDYHADVIPTSNAFGGTLVGINDAVNDEISQDQYVTVKISDSGATDLYLMYNRVEGVHKFLEDNTYRDKIVVVQQDGAGEQSWVRSILGQGQTYTQSNWAGTGTLSLCFIYILYSLEAHINFSFEPLCFSMDRDFT